MRLIPYLVNLKESTNVSSEVYPQKLRTELSYKGNYVKDIEYIEYLNENLFKKGTHLGNDLWTIYTHYSVDNKFYQLGFKIEVDENESLDDFILSFKSYINSNEERYTLRYLPNEDIFIDTNFYKLNRKIKTKNIFDTAGFIILEVENIKNNTKEEIPIRVLPSSIDYEDYIEMINDLISIREDIVISDGSKVGIGNHWKIRKDNYNECIDKIYNHIVQIDKNPKGKLSMENVKIPYNKIKNIKPKTIIEKSLYPYKDKYATSVGKEDFNIYENQIIKYSLIQIKDKIEKYKNIFEKNMKYNESYLLNTKKDIENLLEDNIENNKNILEERINKNKEKIKNILHLSSKNINLTNDKNYIRLGFNIKLNNIENYKSKLYSYYSENDKCFILKLESTWDKYTKVFDYDLGFSEYIYSNLNDEYKIQCKFKTRIVKLELKSNDLRKIKFLYDSLTTNNKSVYLSVIAIRKNNKYDNPLLPEYYNIYNKYEDFTIECEDIRAINGSMVPNYTEEDLETFIEYNVGYKNRYDKEIHYFNTEREQEKLGFIESLNHKIDDLNNEKNKFYDDNSLNKTIDKIDTLLKLDLFNNVKYKRDILKPTQIFINDFSYNKVFRELKGLNKKVRFLDNISPEMIFLKTTCNIYEYWCLFKIVDVLINDLGWKLNNKNDVLKAIDKVLKNDNKYNDNGLILNLEHKLDYGRIIKLELIYEGKIYYDEYKYKTPDFQLKFKIDEEEYTWYWEERDLHKIVYLDAKYRNYEEQGYNQFFDDINNVSIDKYYNTFINTVNKSDVSFIVHSDKNNKYNCFGGNHIIVNNEIEEVVSKYEDEKYENINNHRFGSFFLLPSCSFNINKFLRMILEYHLGLYTMCWTCGEIHNIEVEDKKTISGALKYHFTCNTCKEFWVKNHCRTIGKNHTLVKHYDNYHSINKGKKDPWYVICPACFDGMDIKEKNNIKFNLICNDNFEDDIPF